MKKILGLDLGTNSIGWAVVNEKEDDREKSSITKVGTRKVSLTSEEQNNFNKGKSAGTNVKRTLKHGARINLQRYKLRRDALIRVLKENNFITDDTLLSENGNNTTFETYRFRAQAADSEVTLEQLARVLLMINKKRGYKSNRKAKSKDESGKLIDGMDIARQLYDENLTPGQYTLSLIKQGKKKVPDFYTSDLNNEFERIWSFQKQFYPDLLTDDLKTELNGKDEKGVGTICSDKFGIVGIKRNTKGWEQKKEDYVWRAESLEKKMDLERLTIVFQKICGQIKNAGGYLGSISDRSKELYFSGQTVGQYKMSELINNPNRSIKNQVFYRQDYLDEFERIWETQATFHKELTPELKHEIRDIIIFYQRPLKSQKKLVAYCELESKQVEVEVNGKKKKVTIGQRVCPKSSPLFQEFRIWQQINNIQVSGYIIPESQTDLFGNTTANKKGRRFLLQDEKEILFKELNLKEKMSKTEILKLLFDNYKELDLNYKEVKGNTTLAKLFQAYKTIIEQSGHELNNLSNKSAGDIIDIIHKIFDGLGFNTDILAFDSSIQGKAFEKQPLYRLWHLLYSFEGDKSKTGNEKLIKKISDLYGFDKEYASILAGIVLEPEYGNLSAKAIRKILPFMKDGLEYSDACLYAGYRHSKRSLTKEEINSKQLADHIELLPRNSLRNPVVEKILNQMINVVNAVIVEYGRPDEIRVEMARELKLNNVRREECIRTINKSTSENESYRKKLQTELEGMEYVSRKDIIKYRLYLELESNGFHTLYSNTFIPLEKLFTMEFDVEHILPQAKLFDNSFANKTIEKRSVNQEKGDRTAYDYVYSKYHEKGLEDYKQRVEDLYKKGKISKTKRNRLLTQEQDIPKDFLNRDLSNTQYIARKACEILESVVKTVTTTTGSITSRLREDWQLVDVLKELNWNKYDKLGLTEIIKGRDGQRIRHIKDWTKRNDHRNHAMDALTIAFTKPSFIQYLNNCSARSDKNSIISKIEQKELYRTADGKIKFLPPMPIDEFRAEAKRHLENILVSTKAKNKVVTRNVNVTKTKRTETNKREQVQLTPRGELHNDTIYGRRKFYDTDNEKVNASFDVSKIMTVADKCYREALLKRLEQFDGDAEKAFTGKNSLEQNPLYVDELHTKKVPDMVKTVKFKTIYTQRKGISDKLKIDKVLDKRIRTILEERLAEFNGDAKKAFSNLDENPIWLNKEKGISIKRVTINSGLKDLIALHDKHDNNGRLILDKDGRKQPSDFIYTDGNHHVAIFCDSEGNIQEHLVSFYEAVARAVQHLPVIDKNYNKDKGWQFMFTMKQNEYFVFPNKETGFDPKEIDLFNPDNYEVISRNLYRAQSLSSKDYVFRHHLETTVNYKKELRGITWKRITSLRNIRNIVKVRINHLGQIVDVGEY